MKIGWEQNAVCDAKTPGRNRPNFEKTPTRGAVYKLNVYVTPTVSFGMLATSNNGPASARPIAWPRSSGSSM
ncbi:MAG: hypothetical protein EA426_09770 [Spirochaetaceae bacterium]|nr:MAG: hypothetical protein EA426_09770 [Spirochaetaceae bacterium]